VQISISRVLVVAELRLLIMFVKMMQVVRFNKQNIALICALASVLYFLLHAKTQHIEFEYEVDEKPIIVWEHVADFNNMMSLNPTM
jgi:hypothetical protein